MIGAFDEENSNWPKMRTVFYKQVTVQGVNSYCIKHHDFEKAVSFVEKNEKALSLLLTDEYSIEKKDITASLIESFVSEKKIFKGLINYEQ